MIELMARGGMRIGEVLKLAPSVIYERRLASKTPKAVGNRNLSLFPQRLSDRLKDSVRQSGIKSHGRIFPYV